MRNFAIPCLAFFLAAAALAPPLSAGTPASDEIVLFDIQSRKLIHAPLPAGPAGPPLTVLSLGLEQIFALPSGELLVFDFDAQLHQTSINLLRPDGSLERLSLVTPFGYLDRPHVLDAAFDQRGRLFLLRRNDTASVSQLALLELDPVSGYVGREIPVAGGVQAIATAPDGLWALDGRSLRPLDPDTGALGPPFAELDQLAGAYGVDLDTDSAGRIYILHLQASPGSRLWIFDPESGGLEAAPPQLLAAAPSASTMSIVRAGASSEPAATYLQGRFRVEIAYRAYDGAAGQALPAPARSRDTAIFHFFDEDNWELMVKALDGCQINGHFWVYSAASTDVEYTMTVTDVDTGSQKVYQNPLGVIARTVTDNTAFSCLP